MDTSQFISQALDFIGSCFKEILGAISAAIIVPKILQKTMAPKEPQGADDGTRQLTPSLGLTVNKLSFGFVRNHKVITFIVFFFIGLSLAIMINNGKPDRKNEIILTPQNPRDDRVKPILPAQPKSREINQQSQKPGENNLTSNLPAPQGTSEGKLPAPTPQAPINGESNEGTAITVEHGHTLGETYPIGPPDSDSKPTNRNQDNRQFDQEVFKGGEVTKC